MKNIIYSILITMISAFILHAENINGRFVKLTHDPNIYGVMVQLKSDAAQAQLGGATIIINFNQETISYPETPVEGNDYSYHNFSGGTYDPATITRPYSNQLRLNIVLNNTNNGTVVTTDYLDVVTLYFSVLNPDGFTNLAWQTENIDFDIYEGDNETLFDLGVFTDENSTPLPVELEAFTAEQKGVNVLLKWSTVTEVNSFGFEIERKFENGEDNDWLKIGFVNSSGNSSSRKEYSFVDNKLNKNGRYLYRLKEIDTNGEIKILKEISVDVSLKNKFELAQNFPNPFNPSTVISWFLPEQTVTTIKIYNIIGAEVATLVNESLPAGMHDAKFDAAHLPSGTYIYSIQAGSHKEVKKMLLLK